MSNQMQKSQVYQDGKTGDMGLNGQPTVSVNIQGVIASGSLIPQVSLDGDNWYNISMSDNAGNVVSSIIAAGIFRADVNGYVGFRLIGSSLVTTNLTIQYFTFPEPMLTEITSEADMALIASDWVAGTYPANSVVIYSGAIWSNNASTSGVPGVAGWNQYTNLAALITYILTN